MSIDRNHIRYIVRLCVTYWPNAHLGDYTPREDIRSAFMMIRSHLKHGDTIQQALGALEMDAYRHMDM